MSFESAYTTLKGTLEARIDAVTWVDSAVELSEKPYGLISPFGGGEPIGVDNTSFTYLLAVEMSWVGRSRPAGLFLADTLVRDVSNAVLAMRRDNAVEIAPTGAENHWRLATQSAMESNTANTEMFTFSLTILYRLSLQDDSGRRAWFG